jgi:iron complex outermembrane receptor protein
VAIIGHPIMRYTLTLVALLPLAANADDSVKEPAKTHLASGDDVVVTATREPRGALTTPASVSRIDGADLAELGAKHQSEVLNQSAGVYIQRGSGAESLTAIRSPVLSGAGGGGGGRVAGGKKPLHPGGFIQVKQ